MCKEKIKGVKTRGKLVYRMPVVAMMAMMMSSM